MADLTTLMDKAVFAEISEIDPEWLTTVTPTSHISSNLHEH